MSKIKYFILLLSLLTIVPTTEGARRHYRRTRTYARRHVNKRTVAPQNISTKTDENKIQDSILNVPAKKAEIVWSEKDIPLNYVTKLDSTLSLYKKGMNSSSFDSSSNCDESNNIVLSDSEYISRLEKIPTIMNLSYNNIVKDYILLYTKRKRKLTSYILGQKDFYFPMFYDALDEEGLPLELANLPVIESALNARAYSFAGASGLWQFITSTGKMYGLTINSLVDERRDPQKATKAAVQYLKHLYGIYHDWTLVIAAYNCGPGNVNKAIRRAGGSKDYWEIYYYLPKETRGYVPAFIAANYTMHYYKEHNIVPKVIDRTAAVDTLQVNDRVNLKQISAVLNINIELLRTLNPQYRCDIIPGNEKYNLVLPTDKLNQFEMYKNTILAYDIPNYQENTKTYRRPGIKQNYIASRNVTSKNVPKTKVDSTSDNKILLASNINKKTEDEDKNEKRAEIRKVSTNKKHVERVERNAHKENKTTNNNLLASSSKTSHKIENKQNEESSSEVEKKKETKELLAEAKENKEESVRKQNKPVNQYVVKEGDTLYTIAQRNSVSVRDLKHWNRLRNDNLRIGQAIVVKNK